MTMTTDEFFAEAKRLGCRMHLGPEDQRAAFDLKDAEIERLRAALGVVRRHDAGTMKRDCMETKDDHQFIVRTNEQYAAWCKTYYQLDAPALLLLPRPKTVK